MFKVKFDHVISIGEQCGCAMYLNRHLLRFASYPFDWLGGAGLASRVKLIVNNFEDFLEEESTVFFSKSPDIRHDVWIDEKTQYSFAHDFDKNCIKEEMFPKVKAKYNRRIARFYRSIHQAEKVLLVYWCRDRVELPDTILYAQQELSKYFKKEIYLLVIQNDINTSTCREEVLSEYALRYVVDFRMYNYSESPGITMGDRNVSDPIFAKIRCKGKRLTQFRHFCANVVGFFIPIKSLRRSVRKTIRGC